MAVNYKRASGLPMALRPPPPHRRAPAPSAPPRRPLVPSAPWVGACLPCLADAVPPFGRQRMAKMVLFAPMATVDVQGAMVPLLLDEAADLTPRLCRCGKGLFVSTHALLVMLK